MEVFQELPVGPATTALVLACSGQESRGSPANGFTIRAQESVRPRDVARGAQRAVAQPEPELRLDQIEPSGRRVHLHGFGGSERGEGSCVSMGDQGEIAGQWTWLERGAAAPRGPCRASPGA